MSRARESATRSEAILDKKARQKAAAARKRSEKKQREGQRTIPSLRVPTSTPAPSGPVTPAREARGARRRKRGAGAARGRGDARRRPRPGAGVAGMGSVEASAGFSRRRRSVQEAKEKLRNPGGARTGGGLSRFIVGSRSAVLRSCADSFRGRDEERSRTIGRRRRVPSLRPLSPPSTSARPPPPKTPSSRRARPRRLHRQSVFFLPPSALRLASFRSIACAASTRPTGTSSTDINTYGLFSSVRRPSSASRSGARTSLVACARKRGRSAGSRQMTRPGGRRRLRPRTPRDPRGRFPNREATHLVQQVELILEHPPRRARPTRRTPRREAGTRAVECDRRSASRVGRDG